ncbi:MAG: DUF6982 domain-containing protein [Acidobacteriaceae bacterium]
MSASHKKVIVRRFNLDWVPGYLQPLEFVSGSGAAARLDLLDLSGRILQLPLPEIKMVSFVRDFNPNDQHPERLLRKNFVARPRSEGLWLRLSFRDNDQMEGLAANDLSLFEPEGLLLAPPDSRSNTQRIYVPRTAISSLQVIAVIGGGGRRKAAAKKSNALQDDLFQSNQDSNSP